MISVHVIYAEMLQSTRLPHISAAVLTTVLCGREDEVWFHGVFRGSLHARGCTPLGWFARSRFKAKILPWLGPLLLQIWSMEHRMVCIRGSFAGPWRRRKAAMQELTASKPPSVSESDVLIAWWSKPSASSGASMIQLPVDKRQALCFA